MAKRTSKAAPAKVQSPQPTKAAWQLERHSGEGAASALETLQKIEQRRDVGRPADPRPQEPEA